MIIATMLLFYILIPTLSATGVVADHNLNRLGRYLCYAIAAVAIDVAWGYTGILSLCQAFFFCIGGYAMAMHLALPEGGGDVRADYNNIPHFLFFANPNSTELPGFWRPFASPVFALGSALLLPAVIASLVGFFIFRSRVKGVYFSIITQALAWGAFLAFSRNEMLLGGTNGLTNFYKPLNQERSYILGLYLLTCFVLTLVYLAARFVTRSRLGRLLVAVRDNESRLLFAGYRPDLIKVFAFTFSAVLSAIGGILYAPQTGIITPNIMKVEDSIWMVVWVAMGGRGRLWGALLGALVMLYAQSLMTSSLPAIWLLVQGGIAVMVVLAAPDGLVGIWDRVEAAVAQRAGFTRISIAALPLAALLVFISLSGLGLMPASLSEVVWGLPISYWLLLAALLGGALGQVALRRCSTRKDESVLAREEPTLDSKGVRV
jgi:urea transport system permease protein